MQAEVKDAYWAIFDTEELETHPGTRPIEIIDARITEMADQYSATYPAAMSCLLADRDGLTAYLRFPAEPDHRIRHSNFIVRTFGETRCRTKVIGRLPRQDQLPHPGPGRPGPRLPRLARPHHDQRRPAAAARPAAPCSNRPPNCSHAR